MQQPPSLRESVPELVDMGREVAVRVVFVVRAVSGRIGDLDDPPLCVALEQGSVSQWGGDSE